MDITQTGEPQGSMPAGAPVPTGPKPGNKKMLIIIAVVVVGLATLGWIGSLIVGGMVSFGMRKAIEAGTGVSVDEREGKVTYKGKDGAVMEVSDTNSGSVTFTDKDGKTVEIESKGEGEAKVLPKNFPNDFPVMDSQTIVSTYSMASEGMGTFTIEWSAKQSTEAVHDFYVNALKDKGWRVTAETSSDNQYFITFERGPEDAPLKDGGWLTIAPGDNNEAKVSLFLGINVQK